MFYANKVDVKAYIIKKNGSKGPFDKPRTEAARLNAHCVAIVWRFANNVPFRSLYLVKYFLNCVNQLYRLNIMLGAFNKVFRNAAAFKGKSEFEKVTKASNLT